MKTATFGATGALGAIAIAIASASALAACSSSDGSGAAADAAPPISLGDAAFFDAPEPDGAKPMVDGGFAGPDGSVVRADRFATKVVSFTPGDCAGFGLPAMPGVVLGPPVGAGSFAGGLDVITLGVSGEIVLVFDDNAIGDGPGADFLVFENAFWAGGNPERPVAELAEISVSEDGVTWKAFPCNASAPGAGGSSYGTCAGWRPVYSAPGNGISPVDTKAAGGEPYDLAELGMTSARFVRVRDLATVTCPSNPANKSTTVGFDLDAVAIVNAKLP